MRPAAVLSVALALSASLLSAAPPREPVEALRESARRAAERGATAEALRASEELVRSAPRDIDARLRLAELYSWAHDLDHSITTYEDLLALDPANLRGKMGLARSLRWSHRYTEAERIYKEVLAAAPDDVEAIGGLAHTYALAGDFPGSLALIDRGLARAPDDADLIGLKGTVLAWQGRFDEGLTWAEKAVAQNPRSPGTLRGLGDICMWKRHYDRAASSYRRALELEPGSVDTALDLASAYEAAGRTDLAEDTVKEALRAAPEDRKAMERLQRLRRGDASRWWRAALEATTHAGLPLALAFVLHRRRRLVRRHERAYRVVYRLVLPGLSLAWLAVLLAERDAGRLLFLYLLEPVTYVSVVLVLVLRTWEAGPALDLNASSVLAVGAHPDDIELGAGGLLRRLKEEGTRVYGLVLSQGEQGTPEPARRADEARTGARLLGLDGLSVLDFPDTRLRDCIPDMRAAVEQKIRELGVDLVITHSFREIHGDHVAVFEATKEAARRCSLMCFETVSTPPEFVPNYFVDVTSFLADKLRAVAAHRSQEAKPYMDPESVRGRAAHRGLQVGVPYAEAFWVYRWMR